MADVSLAEAQGKEFIRIIGVIGGINGSAKKRQKT